MSEISKITLPSGNTYDIKDAVARQMISGGVSFVIAWDGSSVPVAANIPEGITVVYNGTTYTGTLAAEGEQGAQAGAFYLVKSSTTPSGQTSDTYDEYVPVGTAGSKTWEKIGDTQIDLSDVVTGVTLTKQTDVALGEGTTFSASGVTVGADGTAAAITGFGTHTTDTFVKSVSAETNKNLVTTTVPNVTGNTDVTVPNITANTTATANKSTWTFEMGNGDAAETLIIGGGNGSDVTATNTTLGAAATASKVTLGTAKTVATGETSTTGTGDAVVTGVTIGSSAAAITALGTPTTSNVLTGVQVTAQPTITVGTNDKVTVLTSGTDVSVTKGNQ